MKCPKCGLEMRRKPETKDDGTVIYKNICINKQCPNKEK